MAGVEMAQPDNGSPQHTTHPGFLRCVQQDAGYKIGPGHDGICPSAGQGGCVGKRRKNCPLITQMDTDGRKNSIQETEVSSRKTDFRPGLNYEKR
jgi:hypothetical protein